jgi:hypothetical protein
VYQRRALKVLNTVPALIAMAMLLPCKEASAGATVLFSYPNGFAGSPSAISLATDANEFNGSAIELTSGKIGEHEAGGTWYKTPVDITAFTTDFTFQLHGGVPVPAIICMTFTVQNSNPTTNPFWGFNGDRASADTNLCGYGSYSKAVNAEQTPIGKSVGIKFDMNTDGQFNYPKGGHPNSTGLYIDGGPEAGLIPQIDINASGIDLYSGHIMAGHVVYDGSIYTLTLRDTVTNAQLRQSWPVDIPTVTGGNTGYVGFTAGTIPPVANDVLSWSFSEGYATRLSSPTFSTASGTYPSGQSVSISAPSGATIYYTTNGRQPTTSSTKYTGPITVSSSEVVQAVAVQSGFTDSFVANGNYEIAPAGTPLINFPNGFGAASDLVTVNGSAEFNGSALQLTYTGILEAGSAWYAVPVNVQTFTTNFTLQFSTPTAADGVTFTIQNQPQAARDGSIRWVSGGPNAVGNNRTGFGYSGSTGDVGGENAGILSSAALVFDVFDGSGDLVGLYTDGAKPVGSSTDMSSSGLNLRSGNPISVALAYNGTTLSMTATDTKTKASFSKSWTIDIPSAVGGSSAYVGFTGATDWGSANPGVTSVQNVLSWTYGTSQTQAPAVPAAPTNLRVQ